MISLCEHSSNCGMSIMLLWTLSSMRIESWIVGVNVRLLLIVAVGVLREIAEGAKVTRLLVYKNYFTCEYIIRNRQHLFPFCKEKVLKFSESVACHSVI